VIFRIIIGLAGVALVAFVRGRRRARREPVPTLTVRGGYAGEDNALYRVEIHRGGRDDEPTFTWSREGRRDSPRQNIPVEAGAWVELENGIDVRFDGATFRTGDAWTFPGHRAADTVTMKAKRR
jgi:hypothetical protein